MMIGRDGLTHNMLNDIHNNWKSVEAVRVKCLGVPTVDMKNVCKQLEVIYPKVFFFFFLILKFCVYQISLEFPTQLERTTSPDYLELLFVHFVHCLM